MLADVLVSLLLLPDDVMLSFVLIIELSLDEDEGLNNKRKQCLFYQQYKSNLLFTPLYVLTLIVY
jgi:hypothetical protein